jgi:hypothetical protein
MMWKKLVKSLIVTKVYVGRGETREGCIYYHESDSKNDRRMHHHEFWKKVKKK